MHLYAHAFHKKANAKLNAIKTVKLSFSLLISGPQEYWKQNVYKLADIGQRALLLPFNTLRQGVSQLKLQHINYNLWSCLPCVGDF